MDRDVVMDDLDEKNQILYSYLLPDEINSCVLRAFDNLCVGTLGPWKLSTMNIASQVSCGLFHELIVKEISSSIPGWSQGKQKINFDLVHESGIQLQIKTKSGTEGIAGNRFSPESTYLKASSYYLCVNFIPHVCICKVRSGWVESDWWKPQNGKGNAATLPREKLDLLDFLPGEYIKDLRLFALDGFGIQMSKRLSQRGVNTLSDLLCPETLKNITSLLSTKQLKTIENMLLYFE